MRLGNPAIRRLTNKASNGDLNAVDSCATYKGVYLKAALYAFLTIAAAIITELLMLWAIRNNYFAEALVAVGIAFGVSFIPLIIIALVIAFVPSTAKSSDVFTPLFRVHCSVLPGALWICFIQVLRLRLSLER